MDNLADPSAGPSLRRARFLLGELEDPPEDMGAKKDWAPEACFKCRIYTDLSSLREPLPFSTSMKVREQDREQF